jgi:hypothetical protein
MLQQSKTNRNTFLVTHNRQEATHFQNEDGQIQLMADEEPLGIPDMYLPERAIAADDGPLVVPPMFPEENAVEDAAEPLQMPVMNFDKARS